MIQRRSFGFSLLFAALVTSPLLAGPPKHPLVVHVSGGCSEGEDEPEADVDAQRLFKARALAGIPPESEPLAAGRGFSTVVVPIVLLAGGASNSFYTSELTLTNKGTGDATVELVYTSAFGGGDGTGADTLPAGRQLIVPDAIAYLRSKGVPIPEGPGRGGTLLVRFQGLNSGYDAAVTVRTTTAVPQGRAGLAYAGLNVGLTGEAYLCGLRQNAEDRSNVAVLNVGEPGSGSITLRLTVHSGDVPARPPVALPDEVLAPGAFKQINSVLETAGFANGYVEVERTAGTAPYYAYGVVNDQTNSDGSFVPPVLENAYQGKSGLSLPVAVEAGTFTTELVITNWGTADRTVNLTYVSDGITTPDGSVTVSIPVAAGQQVVIPSFVQYLRDRGVAGVGARGGTFAGGVFTTLSPDARGIVIAARTSAPGSPAPGVTTGGRFGLFYPAIATGDGLSDTAWVHGLQQNAENRTNLALLTLGDTSGSNTYKIEVFDGETGQLVGMMEGIALARRHWTQFGSVLSQLAPGTGQAYAKVTRTEGSLPFLAYAVVNDGAGPGERSGDGAFLPAERDCTATRAGSSTFGFQGPGPFGWSGADGEYFVFTAGAGGCPWTAKANDSWLSIKSGSSGTSYGTVVFTVQPSSSSQPRSGTLSVAGQTVDVRQLGTAAGANDGTFVGTTSQSKAIMLTVEKNELTALTADVSVSLGTCSVSGTLDLAVPRSRAAVDGDKLYGYYTITTADGSSVELRVDGTFSATGVSGTVKVFIISGHGAVCLSLGGSGPSFTAIR